MFRPSRARCCADAISSIERLPAHITTANRSAICCVEKVLVSAATAWLFSTTGRSAGPKDIPRVSASATGKVDTTGDEVVLRPCPTFPDGDQADRFLGGRRGDVGDSTRRNTQLIRRVTMALARISASASSSTGRAGEGQRGRCGTRSLWYRQCDEMNLAADHAPGSVGRPWVAFALSSDSPNARSGWNRMRTFPCTARIQPPDGRFVQLACSPPR